LLVRAVRSAAIGIKLLASFKAAAWSSLQMTCPLLIVADMDADSLGTVKVMCNSKLEVTGISSLGTLANATLTQKLISKS
jgi:hypothetical protein